MANPYQSPVTVAPHTPDRDRCPVCSHPCNRFRLLLPPARCRECLTYLSLWQPQAIRSTEALLTTAILAGIAIGGRRLGLPDWSFATFMFVWAFVGVPIAVYFTAHPVPAKYRGFWPDKQHPNFQDTIAPFTGGSVRSP